MPDKQLGLQQFLNKLKEVDVGELLEKAKKVKIEDIRSIKFSDLKQLTKSDKFYPSLGITSAMIMTIILLIPANHSFKSLNSKSNQYSLETSLLNQTIEDLNEKENLKQNFDDSFPQLKELVTTNDQLIYFTSLLDDAARRSFVNISEFGPLNPDDLQSCTSLPEESLDGFEFDIDNQDDQFDDESFEDEFDDDMYLEDDEFNQDSNQMLTQTEFSISKDELLENLPEELSEEFQSNHYVLNVKADYINVLNFLRALQEYKIVVIPTCFEPRQASNMQDASLSMPVIHSGEVEARLHLNIPTRLSQ